MVSTIVTPENTAFAVRASQQWWSRPDDQRFLDLESLLESTSKRRGKSHEETTPFHALKTDYEFQPNPAGWNDEENDYDEKGELFVQTDRGRANFTNWSAGQLAIAAGVPAPFLRKIPADLAHVNLRWGLQNRGTDRVKGLVVEDGKDTEIRAFTSDTYGRIWDADVVEKVIHLNEMSNNAWQVPVASYSQRDPLKATTLYASDRDVFVFLVDPVNAIEADGEQLFRGFMVWNSEVGSKTFGLTTFLYRYVCDNRIIWGGKDVTELRIRHTQFGPARFEYEAVPELERYANASASGLVKTVKEAKRMKLGDTIREVEDRLRKKGMAKGLAEKALDRVQVEEPQLDPKTVWAVVQGITALARDIKHTDDRVDLERQAGDLLDMVNIDDTSKAHYQGVDSPVLSISIG